MSVRKGEGWSAVEKFKYEREACVDGMRAMSSPECVVGNLVSNYEYCAGYVKTWWVVSPGACLSTYYEFNEGGGEECIAPLT